MEHEIRKVVTTADELFNSPNWVEVIERRHKEKGHGNRVFRQFKLECGNDRAIVVYLAEMIGLSLVTCELTKPTVGVLMQVQDRYNFIGLKLEEGISRDSIKDELYKRLCKRFPLTDMDVQNCPVE
jgi:hypothetical protein